MKNLIEFTIYFLTLIGFGFCEEILGCGGFVKSHVPIDYSKVAIKLITKQGAIKEQTNCAPNTGYYFIPLYDKGDFILQLEPPPGWSFTNNQVSLEVDGKTDLCSLGEDINFHFKGFGITGKVESLGSSDGPANVDVKLTTKDKIFGETKTSQTGEFFFTPVYPGEYNVSASHPKWKFLKSSVLAKVTEGNMDLPKKSLVIKGYDVNGFVKCQGEPLSDVSILLFAKSSNSKSENCDTKVPINYKGPQPLCHINTDASGAFNFPIVSNGDYEIRPFYNGQQIHFKPDSIEFSVDHNSVTLENTFDISGFSIMGFVKSNGKPISGATVFVNDKEIMTTKADGSYVLENLQTGSYSILIKSKELIFDPKIEKLSPRVTEIPLITPKAFKVCGTVISDKADQFDVSITKIGSTQHIVLGTNAETGEFCEFLTPGSYNIQVNVNEQGLRFYPSAHTVRVVDHPIYDIAFSQLKVSVSGMVKCIVPEDCKQLKVIMRPLDKTAEFVVSVKDDVYSVKDIPPGSYKIELSSNKLCWKENEYTVSISNATFKAPTFVNTGYAVVFVSSHESKISYKVGEKTESILIKNGPSRHCVSAPGAYTFKLDSCHSYASETIPYNTNQVSNEIVIDALKHRVTVNIDAKENLGDIFMTANIDNTKKVLGPLKYGNSKYTFSLMLGPTDNAILTPNSESIFFNPPILSISGESDCSDMGTLFHAKKGKVFSGRVKPSLQGVTILIETENSESLSDETDANGFYKFPALDDSKNYKISAFKDSYILVGPDSEGNFVAQKLAEVVVQVIDKDTEAPLQGALLSLSGPDSYRKNLKTNDDGKIKFPSLNPSEYFLKPMLKEYSFEPPSKVVNVLVGSTVKVVLKGKKVAYSAYGQVNSLNNQPEKGMIVLAQGLNNCSDYIEEATSEMNGNFRIRGLLPYCSYDVSVKANPGEDELIERVLPSSIKISSAASDLYDLRLIVFRPAANVDLFVQVFTPNAEVYKSIRIKIFRETASPALVHTVKIDSLKVTSAGFIQILNLPLDMNTYSAQLESNYGTGVWNKIQSKTIIADNSYKTVAFEYIAKTSRTEQHIKQTSVLTLSFLFIITIFLYNLDKFVEFAKNNMKFQGSSSPVTEKTSWERVPFDKSEINQIVEVAKASKKKVKSKRV